MEDLGSPEYAEMRTQSTHALPTQGNLNHPVHTNTLPLTPGCTLYLQDHNQDL